MTKDTLLTFHINSCKNNVKQCDKHLYFVYSVHSTSVFMKHSFYSFDYIYIDMCIKSHLVQHSIHYDNDLVVLERVGEFENVANGNDLASKT